MKREIEPVAHIYTEFPEKFGIPRQSGLVPQLEARIVFEKKYRNPDALKGIEEFSHLWLLWDFSKAHQKKFTAMVTPPRLGGTIKKGVFATRSPFRPNSIGLSCVELKRIEATEKEGCVLIVSGADILNGTPIYDIKPYLPYTDAKPDAVGGFGEAHSKDSISVVFPKELKVLVPEEIAIKLEQVLTQDPRAAYNKAPDYVYGMAFSGYDIRFTVKDEILQVCGIEKQNAPHIK